MSEHDLGSLTDEQLLLGIARVPDVAGRNAFQDELLRRVGVRAERESPTERWVTRAEVLEARDRFERALVGWQRPPRFAVGLQPPGRNDVWFSYVCHGDHPLPAAVLATVCGHRSGAASYELTRQHLDDAIRLLAPAGACADFDHPNLEAWQVVRSIHTTAGGTILAAFDVDPPPRTDDPAILELRSDRHRLDV